MMNRFRPIGLGLAGAGALMLSLFTGCGEKTLEKVNIERREFVRVLPKNFDGHTATSHLTVSGDGQHIYLTADDGNKLFHGDARDIEDGWSKVAIATGLDGSAGQAKLEKADTVKSIAPAQGGALVTVVDRAKATGLDFSDDYGAFLLAGTEHQAAWSTRAADANVAVPVRKTAAVPVGTFIERLFLIGAWAIPRADGAEALYLMGTGYDGISPNFAIQTKNDLQPGKVDQAVTIGTPPANFNLPSILKIPKLIAGAGHLFAVSDLGVTAVPADQIGQAVNFPAVTANTPANADGQVGSGAFKMDSGVNNDSVISVMVAGDKLYIGLNSDGATAKTGGVAVYQMKSGEAPSVTAPDVAWSKVAVNELVKDGSGTVWALAKIDGNYDLFKAMDDGKRGESYFKAMFDKEGAVRDRTPLSDPRPLYINGAAFTGDRLILSTDMGLLYEKVWQEIKPGSKLSEE